ncbi:MAG: hypothetical protein YSLV5_ORF18 [Yellowstone Lake virophage 5]|uniref:ZZ-type domain-containing protein n=1 Tax=Yellowstone Lake virophage 5 TaxID=1557033 RepID=A0A0A0RJT2_9VIRU|nr:MAG: hypothetical protein ASQ69_gp18 [Yellowstone Lake virophage 5]AIW01876.1 MAG: hypothetical protein YSLV5_ORF18 [Yellowstone Lake virophage 5]
MNCQRCAVELKPHPKCDVCECDICVRCEKCDEYRLCRNCDNNTTLLKFVEIAGRDIYMCPKCSAEPTAKN